MPSRRVRLPEVMDQPGLDPTRHAAALRGLARINAVSRSARILWPRLAALAKEAGRPVRVLDLASGGGDVTVGIWALAKRANLPVHIEGCDVSPTAVRYAADRARAAGADVPFL